MGPRGILRGQSGVGLVLTRRPTRQPRWIGGERLRKSRSKALQLARIAFRHGISTTRLNAIPAQIARDLAGPEAHAVALGPVQGGQGNRGLVSWEARREANAASGPRFLQKISTNPYEFRAAQALLGHRPAHFPKVHASVSHRFHIHVFMETIEGEPVFPSTDPEIAAEIARFVAAASDELGEIVPEDHGLKNEHYGRLCWPKVCNLLETRHGLTRTQVADHLAWLETRPICLHHNDLHGDNLIRRSSDEALCLIDLGSIAPNHLGAEFHVFAAQAHRHPRRRPFFDAVIAEHARCSEQSEDDARRIALTYAANRAFNRYLLNDKASALDLCVDLLAAAISGALQS